MTESPANLFEHLPLLQRFAATQDAYGAYDEWQRDPSFAFPKELLFALPFEERERVLSTTREQRIAHRNRTGFVVPATDSRGRNGWFPIGQVSTFVGFSGMGKTKLVLQMLEAMRSETLFLGDRAVPKKSVLWFQQDRSLEQLHDAYEDICNSREPWFACVPPMAETGSAAFEQIEQRLAEHDHPAVCVIDGMDIIMTDTRGPAIKDLFPKLQRVALNCKCALIATWGSPKRQATKDSYTEARLAASGSAEIGRLSATAAVVTRDPEDDNVRKFVVDTHRSAPDVYKLMFTSADDGWLRPYDPIAAAKLRLGDSKDIVAGLQALGFDWSDVEGQLKMSRSTWQRKKR